jgi:hypothetical protein
MDIPEDAKVWKNRGDEFVLKEQYTEAIQCYDYAVRLDPEFTEAWNNYGYALVTSGRKDDARKIREKINQIEAKKKRELKKPRSKAKGLFASIMPRADDPGYIPMKIVIFSFSILIIGYIITLISESFFIFIMIGLFCILFGYLVYSINVYESGDKYRFLSIFMLLIPTVPYYLSGSSSITKGVTLPEQFFFLMGYLVGGFFIIWLFLLIIVKVKHIFIDTHKNPPNVFFTAITIVFILILSTVVMAAFVFGMSPAENQTPIQNECLSPNFLCKGNCYSPCSNSYVFDESSCICYPGNSIPCGDNFCPPPSTCCKGACYPACPSGYTFNTYDCNCYSPGDSSWTWIDLLG